MYQTSGLCNYYLPITCLCWAPGSILYLNSTLAKTLDAIVSNFIWIKSNNKFLEYYNMPKLFYYVKVHG